MYLNGMLYYMADGQQAKTGSIKKCGLCSGKPLAEKQVVVTEAFQLRTDKNGTNGKKIPGKWYFPECEGGRATIE